jgi:predicted esterase
MIVAHGAGNSAVEMCVMFRRIVGNGVALLCPAGPRVRAGEEGRYFPDHHALEKIVVASVAALASACGGRVDPAGAVYSGYSQGATMGALMIPAHGGEFPRLALVEGGVEGWTLARARQYHDGGGRRVVYACGTPHCRTHAEGVSGTMRKAGLDVRVVADVHAGHTYGGTVASALQETFAWLVTDDPRFAPH